MCCCCSCAAVGGAVELAAAVEVLWKAKTCSGARGDEPDLLLLLSLRECSRAPSRPASAYLLEVVGVVEDMGAVDTAEADFLLHLFPIPRCW